MDDAHEAREIVAGAEDSGRRLDKVLRAYLVGSGLSEIYSALRKGRILVNGAKAGPEQRLARGDRISLAPSIEGRAKGAPALQNSGEPCRDDLGSIADILILATADLLFLNKPRGSLSHGDDGIDGRIRKALAVRSANSLSFSPGPLHRLDRNTTGIITFSRSAAGAREFTSLLRRRMLVKRYLALVDGIATSPGEWKDLISRDGSSRTSAIAAVGDAAHASVTPLLGRGDRSLLLVELRTGLTHQIRVQASSRGLPLSGDGKYGGSPFAGGYVLHAHSLAFREPPFADVPPVVSAPLPRSAFERLAALFGKAPLEEALHVALANIG